MTTLDIGQTERNQPVPVHVQPTAPVNWQWETYPTKGKIRLNGNGKGWFLTFLSIIDQNINFTSSHPLDLITLFFWTKKKIWENKRGTDMPLK